MIEEPLRKELADGRLVYLYRQLCNWKLTVGRGEVCWDEAW